MSLLEKMRDINQRVLATSWVVASSSGRIRICPSKSGFIDRALFNSSQLWQCRSESRRMVTARYFLVCNGSCGGRCRRLHQISCVCSERQSVVRYCQITTTGWHVVLALVSRDEAENAGINLSQFKLSIRKHWRVEITSLRMVEKVWYASSIWLDAKLRGADASTVDANEKHARMRGFATRARE